MKRFTMMLLITLPLIVGCSDQPKISVLESELINFWKKCPEVTITDVKKTNGIQNGRSYDIAYSFKIKMKGLTTFDEFCPNGDAIGSIKNAQRFTLQLVARRAGLRSWDETVNASELTANAVAEFIKTDNGWVYNRDKTR